MKINRLSYSDYIARIAKPNRQAVTLAQTIASDFAEALAQEANKAEHIVGIFDGDADGIMMALIMSKVLPSMDVHILDRSQGYGFGDLSFLHKSDLVICGDIGCSDEKALFDIRKTTGILPFVIDHHLVPEGVLDYPKMLDFWGARETGLQRGKCLYTKMTDKTVPDWCGTGLAYQILKAYANAYGVSQKDMGTAQACMAIGTIADMVRINSPFDTNRRDVLDGMELISDAELSDDVNEASIDNSLAIFLYMTRALNKQYCTTEFLQWNVIPVINAVGKLGIEIDGKKVNGGQYLFDTLDERNGLSFADCRTRISNVLAVNEKRKALIAEYEASDTYKDFVNSEGAKGSKVSFLVDTNVPRGLTGLVAQRLSDALGHPVYVLTSGEDGLWHGSCRNAGGYPSAIDIATSAGAPFKSIGGHSEAFGFAVDEKDINNVAACISTAYVDVVPEEITLDVIDNVKELTPDKLAALEPFGVDFPRLNAYEHFVVKEVKEMANGYAKVISEDGVTYFGKKLHGTKKGSEIECLATISVNEFNGSATVQASVEDVVPYVRNKDGHEAR